LRRWGLTIVALAVLAAAPASKAKGIIVRIDLNEATTELVGWLYCVGHEWTLFPQKDLRRYDVFPTDLGLRCVNLVNAADRPIFHGLSGKLVRVRGQALKMDELAPDTPSTVLANRQYRGSIVFGGCARELIFEVENASAVPHNP
jgi:hypothetical protein